MKKRVKLSDFENSSPKEIKEFLKVDDRRMEQVMRKEMPGAGRSDYEKVMRDMYRRK